MTALVEFSREGGSIDRVGSGVRPMVCAVAVHAALLVAVARVPRIPQENAVVAPVAELSEIALESDREAPPPLVMLGSRAASAGPRAAATTHASATFPSPPDVAEPAAAPADVDFTIGTNPHFSSAPVDLGIGSYWKSVAGNAKEAPEARPARANVDALAQAFRDDRDARDRELGLGAGGPLVTAAHQALAIASAPDVGKATIEFDCDAEGKVVTARLVPAGSQEWENVRREILRSMAERTVHVPSGAHGARVRLSLVAERVSPAGRANPTPAVGAVPGRIVTDDTPGVEEPNCQGEGIAKRCVMGSPFGATVTGVDIVHLVSHAERMVRVTILSETTL